MAEYGCNTNTRQWGEVASLYSENMTSVYSGGLAYEYTVEPNGYGLVEISNGQITPNDDFDRLATAFAATPNPSGDGGYSQSTTASKCPAASDQWEVENDLIPSMPAGARAFMQDGAGTGPGLGDDVTTSHYGGETYSEGLIEMNGDLPTGTNAEVNGTSGSSSGNGNGGSSSSSNGAASRDISRLAVMLIGGVIGGAVMFL